jgi:Na+/melibiose symporter-like transporter
MDQDQLRANINAKIANPLAGFTHAELATKGEEYVRKYQIGDEEDIRAFRLGAILAQDPNMHDTVDGISAEESEALSREISHKWSQPRLLYLVIVLCSTCAAVQGMDETVVNGAQIFYRRQFGIGDPDSERDAWLVGLTNSAPYICCAVIGCWLTIPFNNWFGRRGTIFLTCVISAAACFWQAFTNTWWHM